MENNKVAIYCRVSTEDQNVKQQKAFLIDWCKRNSLIVVKVVMDEESGLLPLTKRKKFIKLLNNSCYDAMVIFNLDRLTRNWDDVTMIESFFREKWDHKRLISAGDSVDLSNASGRMMFRIKMAVSCYMPEDMKEKQRIGIARAKKEGKYKGRAIGSKNSKKFRRKKNVRC